MAQPSWTSSLRSSSAPAARRPHRRSTRDDRPSAVESLTLRALDLADFVPDVTLPAQLVNDGPRDTPARRLLRAIILDAVETIRDYRLMHWPAGRALYRDALAWIADDTPRAPDYITFRYACEALGLEPGAVRAALGAATGVPAVRR